MEIIKDIDQGTDEWLQMRCGSIGGTGINIVASKGKQRNQLVYKVASEIITGVKVEEFKFKHADRGHQYEQEAIDYYSFKTDTDVERVGMVRVDERRHYSPDALVDPDGTIEVKVRLPHIFAELIDKKYFPTATRRQIQWGLYVCQRDWSDYIQFCPEMRLRGLNPMVVERVVRDDEEIDSLLTAYNEFMDEVDGVCERLMAA